MKPARRVLLVEGKNDLHVLSALLKHHAVPQTFQVDVVEGIDNRIQSVRVRLKALQTTDALERIGIVVDADLDTSKRWQVLQTAVQSVTGVALPDAPGKQGTVVTLDNGRRFGAWVMPDNVLPGKLEDFLAFLVPTADVLLPHVDRFLDALPERERCPARFPDKDRIKARIHGWLAVQTEPGKPMGQAITARYLDADAPMASALIDWLRRLFVT
ncbi:MAG: hypothetical protein IT372_12475 [Polyangiaceae bacterium]|nr:hypothetical protein [Polyangiaceae bacterium]